MAPSPACWGMRIDVVEGMVGVEGLGGLMKGLMSGLGVYWCDLILKAKLMNDYLRLHKLPYLPQFNQ